MTFGDFVGILWRRRILILVCLVAVNLGTLAVLRYAHRVFEASAWLLFDDARALAVDSSARQASTSSRREQALQSEVLIAQSPAVIARAVELSDSVNMLSVRNPGSFRPDIPVARQAELFLLGRLAVAVEPNSDLIRISFRDTDPVYAAKVANAVATALRERHVLIGRNPETAEFFRKQEQVYQEELAQAASELRQYETRNQIFSIKEERRLALERRDSLAAELGTTRGSIDRLKAETESLRSQIKALRGNITLPPAIFGTTPPQGDRDLNSSARAFSQDPSLLHIRIYQDSAQKLVTSNAELTGLQALEASQTADLTAIEQRLIRLSRLEEQYAALTRRGTAAESNLEMVRKKAAEAEIDNAWRSNERLSGLQVAQPAVQPLRPVFPRASVLLPLGLLASIVLAVMAALAVEFGSGFVPNAARAPRRRDAERPATT